MPGVIVLLRSPVSIDDNIRGRAGDVPPVPALLRGVAQRESVRNLLPRSTVNMAGKLDRSADSAAQHRLAVAEDVPGDANARVEVRLLGMDHGGGRQARTDLDRASRLTGIEIAHFVDGRMRRPDIFPANARGQGYPRRDAPGILDEGGMPLLTVVIGIVARDDAPSTRGAGQKILQVRKGGRTVEARRRGIVEMDEDLLVAPFERVVAVQVGDFIGEIELVLRPAYPILAAIPQADRGARENAADRLCTSNRSRSRPYLRRTRCPRPCTRLQV